MCVDPKEIYDGCVDAFAEVHGISREETERLFMEETDFGKFLLSGRGGYYAYNTGWKFYNPMNDYITRKTGKIYPYYIPKEVWDLYPHPTMKEYLKIL